MAFDPNQGNPLVAMLQLAQLAQSDPAAAATQFAAQGKPPPRNVDALLGGAGGDQLPVAPGIATPPLPQPRPAGLGGLPGQPQAPIPGQPQAQPQPQIPPPGGGLPGSLTSALSALQSTGAPQQGQQLIPAPGGIAPSDGRQIDPASLQVILQLLGGTAGTAPQLQNAPSLGNLVAGG